MRWIKTDKHVYGAIYREHYKDLGVFGACTCPDGDMSLGCPNPYILTEWGFRGAEYPLIRSIQTKDYPNQEEYDIEYFISFIEEV